MSVGIATPGEPEWFSHELSRHMAREGPESLVTTDSLGKRYCKIHALSDCSLTVARGEVFGLLGPNGAGKTTLIRLLMGYLKPTSGRARVDGLDAYLQSVQVRQRVAYLPGETRLYRQMRGKDTLRFFSDVRVEGDFQRSLALAERFELDISRRVAFMSTGMRQKLALAIVLATETPLWILDEPTANLDPTVRAAVIDIVSQASQQGRTVIFSSHVLSEVEEVCDRVVILRDGRLVHTQNISALRRCHRIRAAITDSPPQPPAELQGQLSISSPTAGQIEIDTYGELGPLLGWLATLPLTEMRIEPIGLRAVYDRFHSSTAPVSSGDEEAATGSETLDNSMKMAAASLPAGEESP
jgi:ABC-2 type transport system ATP-binding protein